MVNFSTLLDFLINLDKYLGTIIQNYGTFAYVILFAVIFAETGFVITPFLPGDSLIFIAGALFSSRGIVEIFFLFLLLSSAAILGDSFNYWIGKYAGKKISSNKKLVKKKYLKKTEEFYKKHGGKTIILARFIPIIRTFAPFVAGIGKMDYIRFLAFNVVGGIIWVGTFTFAGYYFGRIEFVRENLSFFIFFIIFLSIVPVFVEIFRNRAKRSVNKKRV